MSAGLAQPAAPDTVVAVPYTPAEEEGYGEGDYVRMEEIGTAVQARSWGDVKRLSGGVE